ncbi:unnamed protein product [Pleuronectes platessa]|uniref:Uncharacterized protein n=1 Tax=Pleuronectes platessa TaxID=8262 RepID=A0A9N7YLS6_PLEPL|nr:unnamed protein product [Pleuronectes platessa]
MSRRPIRRFSVREALDLFFQTDEDGIGVEPEIEEDVSEIEAKDPDFDPDHHETEQSTYGEEEAPEEEAPGEEAPVEDTPEVTFQSTPASCSLSADSPRTLQSAHTRASPADDGAMLSPSVEPDGSQHALPTSVSPTWSGADSARETSSLFTLTGFYDPAAMPRLDLGARADA